MPMCSVKNRSARAIGSSPSSSSRIVSTDVLDIIASVTARSKTAKCQTGLVVQVPEYLEAGEAILIDTATGTYLSRANVSKF